MRRPVGDGLSYAPVMTSRGSRARDASTAAGATRRRGRVAIAVASTTGKRKPSRSLALYLRAPAVDGWTLRDRDAGLLGHSGARTAIDRHAGPGLWHTHPSV
jgi:hypothetical protein